MVLNGNGGVPPCAWRSACVMPSKQATSIFTRGMKEKTTGATEKLGLAMQGLIRRRCQVLWPSCGSTCSESDMLVISYLLEQKLGDKIWQGKRCRLSQASRPSCCLTAFRLFEKCIQDWDPTIAPTRLAPVWLTQINQQP